MEESISVEELERKIAELTVKGKPRLNEEISSLLGDLGMKHVENCQFDEAIEDFRKAIATKPDNPDMQNNLANVFLLTERESEAIESFTAALNVCPTHLPSLQNLANLRFKLREFDEAERLCRIAVKTSPKDCPIAHKILSKITFCRGDKNASEQHIAEWLRASGKEESAAQFDFNLAMMSKQAELDLREELLTPKQRENEKICKKIISLRNDLKWNPSDADDLGQLNTCLQIICDWKDFDSRMEKLSAVVNDQIRKNLDPPVDSFSAACMFPISLQQQLSIASYFCQQLAKDSTESIPHLLKGKQLRIGYFITGYSKFPLAASRTKFNSDRFEVFYYCLLVNPTLQQELVGDWNDHVIDLSTFGDNWKAAANRIASDGIQILINVNDIFRTDVQIDNASIILSHRPAPIQVVYRTKLGSTGAPWVDYFITDKIASPLQFGCGYSEKLACMPNGMLACSHPEWMIKPQANVKDKRNFRKRFHLPESAIVFAVNSDDFKIDPVTFESWCEILRGVHGSVVWFLLPYLDETQSNLKKEAKKRKINPHRLIFSPHRLIFNDKSLVGLEDRIAIDQLIDVILDTSMCNADGLAFLMSKGIPIVTLPGESFTSRLTASVLTSVGCEELIADSRENYVEIAVKLCSKPETLKQMKDRMRENLPDSNLFRIDQYFNDLGNLFEKMWKWREMGEKPEHLV